MQKMLRGYLHSRYAKSFTDFGIPCELPRCGSWIIKRQIPGFPYYDAMCCYPLFICQDWTQLDVDLEEIGSDLISLSIVTDPFGDFDKDYLKKSFKDVVVPFKDHFIVDLHRSINDFVSAHHRRYARKALQNLNIERCKNPIQFLYEWLALYAILIKRHKIEGTSKFSRDAFSKQLTVPGIVAFRAMYGEKTVGMLLWYIQGEVGYYHLGAFSQEGYEKRVSFGLFWFAINYFAEHGLHWLNLGGGAGVIGDKSNGLSRFKRGWSTGTSIVYFCGRIFDRERYKKIMAEKRIIPNDYFPAYRKGEFR